MYHGLALLLIAALWPGLRQRWARLGAWLLLAGIVLFSGSLYALALGAPKGLGLVTPFGGLAFILGWIAFALGVIYARTPA